ncbi:vesicular glutamate transporter 1-like [Musca domestica]|uniref:Vesicular glutamate transporter 1-like n=1 Tax=Musca domestica TaxID=7370 RepID=A0A1I8M151_MUSDO|nr:vesicular glutamate transporter 1-like [Musca domestica]
MCNVQARTVLWHLVFIGFAVNYMICINLNITIVEMVVPIKIETLSYADLPEASEMSATGLRNNSVNITPDAPIRFNWNEYQQALVLGSFFWAHWLTQIPGGIMAKKYGTKLVFGLANVLGCWLCFLIPATARWDFRALIVLRVLQGLIMGFTWPAMHVMTGKWIPPNERSKFVTAYLGSSVGIAFFYPLFGYIMHWSSWVWVYHFCGIFGTVWWLGWLYFVYDSPAQHPRISDSELRYIEKSLGSAVQNASAVGTPWKEIFLSRPVWMNVIAQFGVIWGLFTLMTQAPTYFRVIHQWDIRATGILSGLPHLMRMIFAYGFSIFADYLLKREKMSRTNVRKLATTICCILMGMVVLVLAYFGNKSTTAIVLLSLAIMFHGTVSTGALASMVDIAPNFAGIVMGISSTIGVLPGFISPYIVGVLTLGNQTFEAWKWVFQICGAILIGCGVLYVLFADSTLQKWNEYNSRAKDRELVQLNEDDSHGAKIDEDPSYLKPKGGG